MTGPGCAAIPRSRAGAAPRSAADPRAQAALLPSDPGVYRFRDAQGRVLYVGRAVDLRRRVRSYWTGAPEIRGLGRMMARIARVEAFPCDSAHEAAWLERNLLERSRPWWNRMAGGLETPVRVAVVTQARRPGLRVVHEHEAPPGSVVLGPYLGGDRVRLALAGLARIAPLAYAGTGLSGSERAMAVHLQVSPADREPLLGRILAVLRRDAAAVAALLAELGTRRDLAAERLDFETAAAIRDEVDAVAWLTAPQRVAGAEPPDAEVAGWCEGWLVLGTIAAGRLDRWLVRPATERAAARVLVATPDGWRPFLERAAVLAARLALAPGPTGPGASTSPGHGRRP